MNRMKHEDVFKFRKDGRFAEICICKWNCCKYYVTTYHGRDLFETGRSWRCFSKVSLIVLFWQKHLHSSDRQRSGVHNILNGYIMRQQTNVKWFMLLGPSLVEAIVALCGHFLLQCCDSRVSPLINIRWHQFKIAGTAVSIPYETTVCKWLFSWLAWRCSKDRIQRPK